MKPNEKVDAVSIGTFPILPSTFAITEQNQVYVADYQSGDVYQIRDTSIQ